MIYALLLRVCLASTDQCNWVELGVFNDPASCLNEGVHQIDVRKLPAQDVTCRPVQPIREKMEPASLNF